MKPEPRDDPAGIVFAAASYILWGLFPLYWRLLDAVPPFEIAIHRILWCAIFVGAVTAVRGRISELWRTLRTTKLARTLLISSLLISANWTIYIFSISLHQVVEASLGYFINPLLSIVLGVALLGEKMSRLRLAAVVLAGAAVAVKAVFIGHVPLIALGLAVTFGFYGYVRKLAPIDAVGGLLVETGMLFPLTVGLVSFWGLTGTGAFFSSSLATDALLIVGGPVTAVPLALFAAGAKRIRLSTLGFVQYFSPSITLLIAVAVFREPFTAVDAVAFGCIWIALILVGIEGQLERRRASAA
jgi:chloramphenicol-sensitive protein RarD